MSVHNKTTWPIYNIMKILQGEKKRGKKAERSIFVNVIFKNIFWFNHADKTLSSEKNDTKIIWIGSVVLILQPFLETQSFTNFVKSARAIYGGYGSP